MTKKFFSLFLTLVFIGIEFYPTVQATAQFSTKLRARTPASAQEIVIPSFPLLHLDGTFRDPTPISALNGNERLYPVDSSNRTLSPFLVRIIDEKTEFQKRLLEFSPKNLRSQFQGDINISRDTKGFQFKKVSTGFRRWLQEFIMGSPVHAADFAPIMSAYDDIEKSPADFALLYLSNRQNPDGSFGTFKKYETTFQIFSSLIEWGKTENDQYDLALQYLQNTIPTNNRERALKVRLLYALGEPYAPLLSELLATKNDDDGFGFDLYYESDVQTSLEVFLTLSQTDILNGNFLTWEQIFVYIENQIGADGTLWFTEKGAPSLYLMNRIAEDLFFLIDYAIEIDKQIYDVQTIINTIVTNLKNQTPVDSIDYAMTVQTLSLYQQSNAVSLKEALKDMQFADGSFGGIVPTMYAVHALAQGDLALNDLVPVGTLTTGVAGSVKLIIHNDGIAPVDTAKVHLFVDTYNTDFFFDFASQQVVLPPNATLALEWPLDNTNVYGGNTEFRYYAEASDEVRYANNWIVKNLPFAKHPQNFPAAPVSFIAYKSAYQETPAIQFVWANKPDSLRKNYVIMYRLKGTTQWTFSLVDPNANQIILHSLTANKMYQVTVGSLALNGSSVVFHPAFTDVTVNAVSSSYLGNMNGLVTVDAKPTQGMTLTGFVIGATSESNGVFSKSNLPNGSQLVMSFDPPYAQLKTRYLVQPGGITNNIRVFTTIVPDSTPPVGSNISILEVKNNTISNSSQVTIVANGIDSVGIKEADFYYHDPNQTVWYYLGTSPVTNNQGIFSWFVPFALKGSGYKVQAILFDYQGNESIPIIFGPFVIQDTTPAVIDTDQDGVADASDNCPFGSNPTQTDFDKDGKGDVCDLPPGDVNLDGIINVVDAQCVILTSLWELGSKVGAVPVCLSNQNSTLADLNCDQQVNVTDVQLSIVTALDLSCNEATGACNSVVSSELDANQDNIVDICQKL